MDTKFSFKVDNLNASQPMDSVNDYTDSNKVGAMSMYCASWNFFAHSNFSWSASAFTNDPTQKEYYKCQTTHYKYTKLKIIRDLETIDSAGAGQTAVESCSVKD